MFDEAQCDRSSRTIAASAVVKSESRKVRRKHFFLFRYFLTLSKQTIEGEQGQVAERKIEKSTVKKL